MPILHMETTAVRTTGQQLNQLSQSIEQQLSQLTQATNRLDNGWDGMSAHHFMGEMRPLLQHLRQVSQYGIELSQRVEREVQEWEETSRQLSGGASYSPFHIGLGRSLGMNIGDNFFESWLTHRNEKTGVDNIHTEYTLLDGYQADLKLRYRQGKMTEEEFQKAMEEVEKSLLPDYVKGDLTLYKYKFAEVEAQAGVALARGDWEGENWDASVRAFSAEAEGQYEASAKLGKDGLQVQAGAMGEVGVYAARVEANAEIAGVDVATDAYVGAQAQGHGNASIAIGAAGLSGTASAGISAFAGGRIDGSASKKIDTDVVDVEGKVKGSLSYGVGVTAEADVGFEKGTLKADVDIGATLGLGGELGFEIEVDVTDAADEVADIGKSALNWGKNLF